MADEILMGSGDGLRIYNNESKQDILHFPDVKLDVEDQQAWFGSPLYTYLIGTNENDWLYGGVNTKEWINFDRPTKGFNTTIENVGLGIPNVGIVGLRCVDLKSDTDGTYPYAGSTGQLYLDFPGMVAKVLEDPLSYGLSKEFLVKGINSVADAGSDEVSIAAPATNSTGRAALKLVGSGSSNLLQTISTGAENGILMVTGGTLADSGKSSWDYTTSASALFNVNSDNNTVSISGRKAGQTNAHKVIDFRLGTTSDGSKDTVLIPGYLSIGGKTILSSGSSGTSYISFPVKSGTVALTSDVDDLNDTLSSKITTIDTSFNTFKNSEAKHHLKSVAAWAYETVDSSRRIMYEFNTSSYSWINNTTGFARSLRKSQKDGTDGVAIIEDVMGPESVTHSRSSTGYYQPGWWITADYADAQWPVLKKRGDQGTEDWGVAQSQVVGLGLYDQCWHATNGMIFGSHFPDAGIKLYPLVGSTNIGSQYQIAIPAKSGTMALTSDIPNNPLTLQCSGTTLYNGSAASTVIFGDGFKLSSGNKISTDVTSDTLTSYYKRDGSTSLTGNIPLRQQGRMWVGGKIAGSARLDMKTNGLLYVATSLGFVDDTSFDGYVEINKRVGTTVNEPEMVRNFGSAMALGGIATANGNRQEIGLFAYTGDVPVDSNGNEVLNYCSSRLVYNWSEYYINQYKMKRAGWLVDGYFHVNGAMGVNSELTVYSNVFAPAFYESSDARLKENIKTPSKTAQKVNIKEFNLKGDKVTRYGVIAQEIEDLGLENLVSTNEDGMKSVDYISLLCLMVKDLRDEVQELKRQLAEK